MIATIPESTGSDWQQLANAISSGIIVLSETGCILYANPSACSILGRSLEALKGTDFAYPIDSERVHEIDIIHPDQHVITAEITLRKGFWENAEAWLVSIHDITQRKLVEENMALAAGVFSNTSEGICITDIDANIVDVNDAFCEITGYSKHEVMGNNPRILQSGRHDKAFYEEMWQSLLQYGYWRGQIWNRRKNGEVYPENLILNAVYSKPGIISNYIGMFLDISELKSKEARLEYLALHDPLTGLPNRNFFTDHLRMEMHAIKRQKRKLAVVFIDLDDFKSINDNYSHEVGDRLLNHFSRTLSHAVRQSDIIGRFGGDEFVALLSNFESVEDCDNLIMRLLKYANKPVTIDNKIITTPISIGIALYPQNTEVDAEQLLRQADQAMYQAKLAGKNQVKYFDQSLDEGIRERHQQIEEIRLALSRDEFELYYQPKVNMRSGEILGLEALIRQRTPQGIKSPGMFLPVIETHPLSIEIGEWVLNSALKDLSALQSRGHALQVSVNIGALQMQHGNFVDFLNRQLAAFPEIPPALLELEIVESSALVDMDHAIEVIQACRAKGINFSIDDFGTGFASLTYAKKLPVNTLKVDQSFVRDIFDDIGDFAILDAILSLSRTLDYKLIAEGVETLEHGRLLLRLGYNYAQGYAIARPMPLDQVENWINRWQPDVSWQNAQIVNQQDLPALIALTSQISWTKAATNFLTGKTDKLPTSLTDCAFGRWLKNHGSKRFGEHAAFARIHEIHHNLHRDVEQLIKQKTRENTAPDQAALDKVTQQHNDLIDLVDSLINELAA